MLDLLCGRRFWYEGGCDYFGGGIGGCGIIVVGHAVPHCYFILQAHDQNKIYISAEVLKIYNINSILLTLWVRA